MPTINFDNALGIHPQAVQVRSQRAEILANNIANADTPGFKARDLDFQGMLKGEYDKRQRMELARTNASHIPAAVETHDSALKFRIPNQPAVDGNTVEADIEQGKFAQNSLQYQSSFTFLNSKFKGLSRALKSE
ncbi:flagellar basal-body rod protein FlgB [Allopseudospirillum japonicum]|uniref:Flagellar basal body rod protein FlgB n=1 Tax=Allopseudospirillum japonicum TaxID=64971 RepID=A0A1H6TCU6_9GAMM|nr:flagellar basal body rod protein FlgB [Allopseudospirillum japonicum]SEI77848.1 flagellar basal-body rod protein FlgB [Allopseudospirillum japonicum]